MCNKTGIPEFLESRILRIPVVAIVTSRTRSLRDPTQQDFIHTRTLPIYMCVEYTMRNRVQSGRNTKKTSTLIF